MRIFIRRVLRILSSGICQHLRSAARESKIFAFAWSLSSFWKNYPYLPSSRVAYWQFKISWGNQSQFKLLDFSFHAIKYAKLIVSKFAKGGGFCCLTEKARAQRTLGFDLVIYQDGDERQRYRDYIIYASAIFSVHGFTPLLIDVRFQATRYLIRVTSDLLKD